MLVLIPALVGPAQATTYIMPTDAELLAKADLVVVGRVLAADAAYDQVYSTDWSVEVSDLVKGFLPGSNILVRQLGGLSADGDKAMMAIGAAPLRVGEEYVLFLEEHQSGTYRVMDLALGAFWHVPNENLAVRALGAAHGVDRGNDAHAAERARSHLPRHFDAFVSGLKALASGEPGVGADYFVTQPSLIGAELEFNLTRSPPGNPPIGCPVNAGSPVRWQQFDNGESVLLFANEQGQLGVNGGGFSEIQQAIAAWSAVSATNTNLVYGGTTPVTAAVEGVDFLNSIAFEDPNDFIPGSYTSNPNGVIGVTLVFFSCDDLHTFLGGLAHTLIEIGIVTQDGTGSFFFNATNFLEVMAHEIGHAFGIGHSCGDADTNPCAGNEHQAIMHALVHDDGRGAQLNSDDEAALRALYGTTASNRPAAPTNLVATASSTSTVELLWADNASDETGYSIEQRLTSTSNWSFLGSIGPNSTEVQITGLLPETSSEFRVRAFSASGYSDPSNTAEATTFGLPGPCVEDATTLCLLNDRFKVTVDWEIPSGTSGQGQAVELTSDTGYFWFFSDTNVETVIKVLDACGVPGFNNFWVFAGGLTDVEVSMTVVDSVTGGVRTYSNPQNTPFQPIQDTAAFLTCP